MDNYFNRGGRLGYFLLASAVVVLLVPYILLFRFVGSFPAEDAYARDALPDAYFIRTLCSDRFTSLDTDDGKAVIDKLSMTSRPVLRVRRTDSTKIERIFKDSDSLFFSSRDMQLIALDNIGNEDLRHLHMLVGLHVISKMDLNEFIQRARLYYPPCSAPVGDRGITEGYWAAKGTSVLHHWVHLYEGGLGWRHAQYGYLVPSTVRLVLMSTDSLGPTRFVQMAWIIFAIIGIAYVCLFYWLFRDHPYVALSSIFLKITVFCLLGPFALLLAPGYQWFRELIQLIVVVAVQVSFFTPRTIGRRGWILYGIVAIGCYFMAPVFFAIAVFSAAVAAIRVYAEGIVGYLQLHKTRLLWISIMVVEVGLSIVYTQLDNIGYVMNKLTNQGEGLFVLDWRYVTIAAIVGILAASWFIFFCRTRAMFVSAYFAIFSLLSILYYAITPDKFHFLKFVGYSVPFLTAVAIALIERGFERNYSSSRLLASWGRGGSVLVMLLLSIIAIAGIVMRPNGPQLRIMNSLGEPYFRTKDYIINHRLIRADMSPALAMHLRNFPMIHKYSYVVSPYDKYITFLYDRENGFDSPDLVAWLDSNQKSSELIKQIAHATRPVGVLLDPAIISVDTRVGITRNNSALGDMDYGSKLNVKGRLRAAAVGAALLKDCRRVNDLKTHDWLHLVCGNDREK